MALPVLESNGLVNSTSSTEIQVNVRMQGDDGMGQVDVSNIRLDPFYLPMDMYNGYVCTQDDAWILN
jgi:hypothetical protein